jgi:hypothetical protein
MGNCPLKYVTAQKIRRLVDMKADQPGAAANRRKHLSALCGWGVDHNYLPTNLARDVKTVPKIKGGGYYTWTTADVEQFLAHYKTGTRAGAGAVAVHRRPPAGHGDIRQAAYPRRLTLYKRRDVSQKPFLPVLADIIASSPCGSLTFLETAQAVHGRRLRQLVPRSLRRGRPTPMFRPWPEKGRRHPGGGKRRHRLAIDGDVRLVDHQPGRSLHPGGGPQADGRRGHGADQSGPERERRLSHRKR